MKRKQVPKILEKTVKLESLHETNFKGLRYGSPVFSVGFVQRYSHFFPKNFSQSLSIKSWKYCQARTVSLSQFLRVFLRTIIFDIMLGAKM